MNKLIVAAVAAACLSMPGVVAAQTTTAKKPAASTMAAAPKPATMDAKAAKSKECSAQADAKGLHGKERKKFREACKKG
jgi:hypothetical protein